VLLRLYPRAWRRRYGAEMQDLLASERLSLRTLTDLLAGAIDARLNPQLLKAADQSAPSLGGTQIMKATICNPAGISRQDQWRSAAWMVGGSLLLTVAGVLLKLQVGPNSFSEGLIYSAFPASLMLSSECTYLKRYSGAARTAMSVGGAVFMILVMWAAVAIGYRI